MEEIIIRKSNNADSRTADVDVTKDELMRDTLSHILDVRNVGYWISEKLQDQLTEHDYTKIDYIDEFYHDFIEQLNSKEAHFKEMPWFKNRHMTERHHLNDSVPEDVNLIDVLEMVIDCTVAGLARSGNVYPITISPEILQKAVENTSNLIINNTKIVD